MGAIQSPDVLFPKNRSTSLLTAFEMLESKIAVVESEMNFYHKLLSWLLYSCHEDKRHVIESFRDELADLRNGGFSEVLNGAEAMKNMAQGESVRQDLYSDIDNLLKYFQFAEHELQSLKSRIQQGFGDFTHVCIW